MLVSTIQRIRVPCAIQQVLISYLFYTYKEPLLSDIIGKLCLEMSEEGRWLSSATSFHKVVKRNEIPQKIKKTQKRPVTE